ncbi:hypothetical protein QYE76_042426 [Lolium multiflorum]|uniref:Uncharacterized protein n=1 Tax=Lolium multiflorum TaxID=4521 RepID=A0AAD8TH67_LOLMU|nr:hypothetical protein QYE76_042426 [Lolium multiflorum]
MSERKRLRRMMLFSRAGNESRYMKISLPRPNQVLADKIMTLLELLRLLPPRQPRRVFSPLKTTWTFPLANRAKSTLGRKASVQEPKPSPAKSTPPSRTTVEKIPVSRVIPAGSAPASSAARDHPIYATVDAVVDFAEQFTRLEAENAQLRKTVKSSADQVLEANMLATDAKKVNALLKEEVSKLKQQMKDEQDARRAAAVAIDKREGVLRESIKDLLEAANITVTRRHQLRVDSTSDAMSLAAESNVQVLGLLQKTRGRGCTR